jgi:hypothetical protein|tara:strand:+ start:1537 stop:2139 length:603 start_codon:yes stop_codon:yes gene_type:complete
MLLRDFNDFQPLQILSEAKGTKTMKVRGIFSEAERKNGNGRIYAKTLLEREVQKLQPLLAERRLCGELDHPNDEVVHLANVSHIITNLQMEGNKLIGEAEFLDTPSGRILQELAKAGVRIGISSRATGSVEHDMKEDAYMVQDNLRMITWDMVADPSCQNAFPELVEHKQLMENRNINDDYQSKMNAEKIYLTALRRLLK